MKANTMSGAASSEETAASAVHVTDPSGESTATTPSNSAVDVDSSTMTSLAGAATGEVTPSASHHQQPSLDMESLLRQWGGNSLDVDADSGINSTPGMTSTDVAATSPPAHLLLGRSHSTTNDHDHPSHAPSPEEPPHRRIASTGGNRLLVVDPPSSPLQPPSSATGAELHDAARITNWPLVAALSKSNPALAKYSGPDKWTALHHACSRRCPHPEVIEALVRAHPLALVGVDDRGWTPLCHACRFKAPKEVVRLLLRAFPSLGVRAAKMRCSAGRSALYYAMRYEAPSGVVEMLLQADPGAVVEEDRDGMCPLGLVWEGYAGSFGGRRDLKGLLRRFEGDAVASGAEGGRMEELAMAEKRAKEAVAKGSSQGLRLLQSKWKIVNNLLRAYFHFPVQSLEGSDFEEDVIQKTEGDVTRRRKWRILHAVSAIKCHHTLFLLARALHPEQAWEIDENDLFGVGHDAHGLLKPPCPALDKQVVSNRTALHFAAMSPLSGKDGRNVIKTLLSLYPAAPQHDDGYGSLPLHLMAENDHKVHWVQDGFRDVYNAYQEALSRRDGLGRTPLHCATSSSGRYTSTPPPQSPTAAPRPQSPTQQAQQTADQNVAVSENTARDLGSVIQNLVVANRSAASIADNTGRLPLHYIAEHGEEWNNDAECILAAYPAASRARAGGVAHNQLPLHMAASNPDACPSLIISLVNANPRAASLTDATGRLPLHKACDSGRTTWDRGMESIFNAYHAAISTREDSARGWTVLHTAVASHSVGLHLIEHVLNLNPGAASIPDGEGRYPLHLACAAGRRWEEGGVRNLFAADPSVAMMEDNHGLLPFHIVALKTSTNVSSLAEDGTRSEGDDFEGTNVSDGMEENTEEDLASLDVLFNLLIAQPSTVQTR
ncbi:hypothetical protein HJC23_012753 [Cyclotella cryptica]|uniref:Ankyrin n=1 Tax=Cyclotella cryptica TaxID=29204 RepID=A0ABD3Q2Z8_9STRA|eukprot:CCRYP_008966-RA/>CCRYP_008966-RA protein AED:0.14 eAED:0.14 QI:0/-1/0/1/-1/1/1/0/889